MPLPRPTMPTVRHAAAPPLLLFLLAAGCAGGFPPTVGDGPRPLERELPAGRGLVRDGLSAGGRKLVVLAGPVGSGCPIPEAWRQEAAG